MELPFEAVVECWHRGIYDTVRGGFMTQYEGDYDTVWRDL